MIYRSVRLVTLTLVAAVLCAACEKAKSANPLSPDVAGPLPGVEITAPRALEPPLGATLTVSGALTSLVIANPSSSGVRGLWLQLQIASDAGFQQVLHTAERVAMGAGGKTTYTLPEPLGAGHTYYWRTRATDGANTGPLSSVAHFSIVEPVLIEAPVPIEPSGTLTTRTPAFKVRNPRVSGPAGPISIRFEVSRTLDPANLDALITVAPGADGTATMTLGELPYDLTVYWRAQATDNQHTSAYSPVQTFRTPAAPPPPPPPPPPVVTPPTPTPPPTPAPTPTPPPSSIGGARNISTDEALAIIRSVHDREGWNLGSRSSREQRVEFLHRAVAAIHYGHATFNPRGPDANWCVKDAGGGRPPSDDVIVRCDSRDAWDLIGSSGADGYSFHLDYIGRLPGGQNVYAPPRSALPR